MMQHDDMHQDTDMIKSVLQKIVDEMEGYEADRIMPDHKKPKLVAAKIEAVSPDKEEMMDPESSDLDPKILAELMDKAGQADDEGMLPEDHESDLDPEIARIIAEKRKQKLS